MCCACWSEILHCIIEESCRGLSFWSFLCCFCICCHILQRSWWQFPPYPVLSVPGICAPGKVQLLRIHSFISFLSFLISSEIVQNVNNTSRYWYKYINSQSTSPWSEWDSLCSSKAVFHESADSGVLSLFWGSWPRWWRRWRVQSDKPTLWYLFWFKQ